MNSDSKFIPNSYQTPNWYVDQYMAFLTAEEWEVLAYIIHVTYGPERNDHLDGVDAFQIADKTGLFINIVTNALSEMVKYGLVKNTSMRYFLEFNNDDIDITGLIDRKKRGTR